MRWILASMMVVWLAGCASRGVMDATPRPETVQYRCADQTALAVTYAGRADGVQGTANMVWDGRSFPLRQDFSGSGARYSDGTLTLVTKGDEAFVEKAGEIVLRDCSARD